LARAIHEIADTQLDPMQQQARAMGALLQNLVNDTDAVKEVLKTIHLLHEKDVLNIVNALLEQGSDIMKIVVDQAGKPGYAGGLKNGMALVQLLGTMDTRAVSTMVHALGKAQQQATAEGATQIRGVFGLLGALRDPDVSAGMSFMVQILKSVGQGLRGTGDAEQGG
jgi:uncharacterized protein YjgD (DUF1641 family)